MEKIGWTDHARNGEVLQRVKGQRNILHTRERRKAKWMCRILRRNCLLKHVIEENRETTWRRWKWRKQLLDDPNETTWHCNLEQELLNRNLWRTRFRRAHRPVARNRLQRRRVGGERKTQKHTGYGNTLHTDIIYIYIYWSSPKGGYVLHDLMTGGQHWHNSNWQSPVPGRLQWTNPG
jgi:hypothetical protein